MMEDQEASLTTPSMINNPLFPHEHSTSAAAAASAEESGWTIYFEDLHASGQKEELGDSWTASNSSVGGSSLISDAASCAAWKFPAAAAEAGLALGGGKKLSFKRRKAKGVLDEDPLEDTASSPVNSPKVSEMLSLNLSKKDENKHISISHEERSVVDFGDCTEVRREEVDGNDFTELKKRGLCLVPLSMLVNYLG